MRLLIEVVTLDQERDSPSAKVTRRQPCGWGVILDRVYFFDPMLVNLVRNQFDNNFVRYFVIFCWRLHCTALKTKKQKRTYRWLQLDTPSPEPRLDLRVPVHDPPPPLTARRENRGLMGDLLSQEPEALFRRDELKGLVEERVEGLAGAPLGGAVGGDGKGGHLERAFEGVAGEGGRLVQKLGEFKVLTGFLEGGEGLVEVDGEADPGDGRDGEFWQGEGEKFSDVRSKRYVQIIPS